MQPETLNDILYIMHCLQRSLTAGLQRNVLRLLYISWVFVCSLFLQSLHSTTSLQLQIRSTTAIQWNLLIIFEFLTTVCHSYVQKSDSTCVAHKACCYYIK